MDQNEIKQIATATATEVLRQFTEHWPNLNQQFGQQSQQGQPRPGNAQQTSGSTR